MTEVQEARETQNSANNRLLFILAAISLGMVGFGFALAPLYYTFCKAFGVQISPNNERAVAPNQGTGRKLEVYFEQKVFDNLPVRFFCDQERQDVEVGVDTKNVYHFQNLSDKTVHFRPIHQVSPPAVGEFFKMKVCFCFKDQIVEPGETREFPVVYNFMPGLDERITNVTIRYSLFEIEEGAEPSADQKRIQEQVEGAGAIVTPGFKKDN